MKSAPGGSWGHWQGIFCRWILGRKLSHSQAWWVSNDRWGAGNIRIWVVFGKDWRYSWSRFRCWYPDHGRVYHNGSDEFMIIFFQEIQKSCHPWWLHLRWSNEWPDVSRLWRRGNFFPGNGWTRWVPVLRRCVRQLHFAWARNGAFALLAAQLMALAPRSVKWQCSSEQEVKCQKYRRI